MQAHQSTLVSEARPSSRYFDELSANKSLQRTISILTERINQLTIQMTSKDQTIADLHELLSIKQDEVDKLTKDLEESQCSIIRKKEAIKYAKNGILGICMLIPMVLITVRKRYSTNISREVKA